MNDFINQIFCCDNLELMSKMSSNTIDLIYLDPPFNSKHNYLTFAGSFKDTWGEESLQNDDIRTIKYKNLLLFDFINLFLFPVNQKSMYYYLIYMTVRLLEMQRILKNTGSIYIHCDQSASHYLKVIMDIIFGAKNFRNEIVWKRTTSKKASNKFPVSHDKILFYIGSDRAIFNNVYTDFDESYIEKNFQYQDKHGKYGLAPLTGPGITKKGASNNEWNGINPSQIGKGRHWAVPNNLPAHIQKPADWDTMSTIDKLDFLHGMHFIYLSNSAIIPRYKKYLSTVLGVQISDMITNISNVGHSKEDTGYPTQKPLALLEIIIKASSNQGDVVFDPFCGSGTTLLAAKKLGRQWIGSDNNKIACDIAQNRL